MRKKVIKPDQAGLALTELEIFELRRSHTKTVCNEEKVRKRGRHGKETIFATLPSIMDQRMKAGKLLETLSLFTAKVAEIAGNELETGITCSSNFYNKTVTLKAHVLESEDEYKERLAAAKDKDDKLMVGVIKKAQVDKLRKKQQEEKLAQEYREYLEKNGFKVDKIKVNA